MISLGTVMTLVSACAAPSDDATDEELGEIESEIEETDPLLPSAADVLAKLATCRKASARPYAKDASGTANIDVCDLPNAVFFTGDMDIDCDGKPTAVCNRSTDASFQSQTAGVDSKGKPLDASTLPFVVVPGVSNRWSYKASGIKMGSVAAVIYNGKIEYGVVGDVGPQAIIGEASYAMAKRLGINPNPSTGGVASGVTYVVFKGPGVSKLEDQVTAKKVAVERTKTLVAEN